jgi:hypothetical protein
MQEKRRSLRVQPRGLVSKVGQILLGQNAAPIDCTVIDLSAGGARLSISRPQDLPNDVEFQHGGVRRKCRVVWRRGFQVGIAYSASAERSGVGGGLSRRLPSDR